MPGTAAPLAAADRAPSLWSVAEAAARLTVDRKTVYRLVRAGALPHTRVGSLIRIRPADVAAYLTTSRTWTPSGRGPRRRSASS